MRRRALLCGLAAGTVGCLGRDRADLGGTGRHSLVQDGRERTYLRWAPDPGSVAGTVPLVVVLHGGGGSGRRVARTTRFASVARREGAVAVFPDAGDRRWNDGREFATRDGGEVDDVAFLRRLVADQVATLPVDPDRVYVTGISNGAMMSMRLAIQATDVPAAIAPVSGSLPVTDDYGFDPGGPVSVALVHGTDDPLSPHDGGGVGPLARRGEVLGVDETVARWRRHNGCGPDPRTETVPDTGSVRVEHAVYPGCTDATVERFTLYGAGHGWPGRDHGAFALVLGPDAEGFDATAAIWEFFTERA